MKNETIKSSGSFLVLFFFVLTDNGAASKEDGDEDEDDGDDDGETTHITRTKRIIRQFDSFITCCIICGNLNVKDGSDV